MPQLTLAQVLDAARVIVEADGAQRLTMRRLAERLNVSPMGVYRYVANKDELLILLLNESLASVAVPPAGGDPRHEIVAIYRAMRTGLATHGWALDPLVRGRLVAPAALPLLERLYAALLGCGLTEERAVAVNRVLWNMMIGDLVAAGTQPVAGAFRGDGMADMDSESLPRLAAMGQLRARAHDDDTFEDDLMTLVVALCGSGADS